MGESKQDLLKQLSDFGSKFRSQALMNKSPSGEDYHSGANTSTLRNQRNSSLKRPNKHGSSFISNNNI